MRILDTMTCMDFASLMGRGELDDGATAAIVSTSSKDFAGRIEEAAWARGIGMKVLVLEYDDIDFGADGAIPQGDRAFNPNQARAVVSFVNDFAGEVSALLPVCDGSVSRSAAVRAAAVLMGGGDDLDCWTDVRYRPNVLVYYRLLQAVGITLTPDQVMARLALKQRLLNCKTRKVGIHGMHLSGEAWRAMADGRKDVELRLLDEKRARVRPGDVIVFEREGSVDVLLVTVRSLHAYSSFERMFGDWPDSVRRAGFSDAREAVEAMEGVYTGAAEPALAICLGFD